MLGPGLRRSNRSLPNLAWGGEEGFKILARHDFGWRMPITGSPDMQRLGEAVHSSFACDALNFQKPRTTRVAKIAANLHRWSVVEVAADDILIAADRLWSFITTEFSGSEWRAEVALSSQLGDQLVRGRPN